MDFSLDNPGFADSIASDQTQDAPKSFGSSSASGGQKQCSCAKCPTRMSSIDRDKHLPVICIKCRGYECSVALRCEECKGWSKEEMLSHEKVRKSLASKAKGRGKSTTKTSSKTASPPSTSADRDLDDRFAAQYDRMVKDLDDRMALLSSSLVGQIKDLIAHDRPDDPNYQNDSVLPGQAGLKPVPEPPQPQAKFQ